MKMEEKIKTFAWILGFAVLTALAFLGLGAMIGYERGMTHCIPSIDTVVIHHTDTVTLTERRVDTLTRVVERLRPVAVHDTVREGDTLYVPLPYESRHYYVPDTLDVWYSGIDPAIDSVRIYWHWYEKTATQVKEVPRTPPLTLDLGAGAMYHERQVSPYLVGEVRYNARKTTWGAFGAINHEGRWCAGGNVTYRINLLK